MVQLDEVKDFLRITSTDKDTWLTSLITASKQLIEKFTGMSFTYAPASSRFFDGTGANFIILDSPVSNITDIKVDGVSVSTLSDFVITDLDYIVNKNENYVFPVGIQNIEVIADWGYITWPEDLKMAQLMLIAWLYKKDKDEISIISRVYQGQSTIFLQEIPQSVLYVLQFYKRSML